VHIALIAVTVSAAVAVLGDCWRSEGECPDAGE
jgi:hypothetical protein